MMRDKPTYLGLLNAIAVNETRAHRYLGAWMEVTSDPEVRSVLATVTAREGEHGMSFAKRMNELGFSVREISDPQADEQFACASSTQVSDLEKIEALGLHELDKLLCAFDDIFKDHSIDIATGELLGRYIAEEFDSARLLRRCYEQLCDNPAVPGEHVSQQLESLEKKVDELQRTMEELRQIVCAQSMTVNTNAS